MGPPSAQTGAVITLTAIGDRLVAGMVGGDGRPSVDVLRDGRWSSLPVSPVSPYGREARWSSIAAGSDGRLVAVGGARGGAHSNVRWSVWRGSVTTGLIEEEQLFSTFGGWGAGELVGPVVTRQGPLLIGSWESARAGLDVAVWLPDGATWLRQSSAGTALESQPDAMLGARSVTPWQSGALISGSVLRLGNGGIRKVPSVWRAQSPRSGWTREELPDSGASGEATAATCEGEGCTVVGSVDGHLAIWRLDAAGSRRLGGIPSVAVRESDEIPAPVFVNGTAVVLVTDHDQAGNSTLIWAGPSGWSRGPGPAGAVVSFAALGATLYAVCRHGDTPWQVWSRPF